VPRDAPAAVVGLGEVHPGPLRKAGVAGGFGDDIGQSAYGGELLVPVEGTVAVARAEQDLEPFDLVARQVIAAART